MEIDRRLAAALRESGLSLTVAESCTGGLIAARITSLPGSSAYFQGSVVAYSNRVKADLLQVPQSALDTYGAVSEPVAQAMAEGVRRLLGSDLALAVTGVAGPDGGTVEKPVGTVFIAIADQHGCRVERFSFDGNRDQVRQQTADQGLIMAKERLEALKRT